MCALLAAALVGSGCGRGGSSDDGPITVQVFGDPLEADGYRELVTAYRKSTGRSVRLVTLADRDSHLAKLTTSFAAGRPPDAFVLSYRNFGPFVSRSVVEPVGAVNAQADLFPAVRRAFTVAGRLQCQPVSASPLVVYVNRGLFAAAGVAVPSEEWRFEDFFRAALELRAHTRAAGAKAHPLGLDPILSRLAVFIWTAGGELVDDEARPARFAFESAGARRGIDRFLSLYREGLVPTENAVEADPLNAQFRDGRLAMFISTRREVATFRDVKGLDWDVAPFPAGERRASALEAEAVCVARGARAAAAAEFAAFAGSPEGQRALSPTGRFMPVLRAVAQSDAFLQPASDPSRAGVFVAELATARALPSSSNWPRIEDSASLAFKQAFYAEVDVNEAIDRIEAETKGLF